MPKGRIIVHKWQVGAWQTFALFVEYSSEASGTNNMVRVGWRVAKTMQFARKAFLDIRRGNER